MKGASKMPTAPVKNTKSPPPAIKQKSATAPKMDSHYTRMSAKFRTAKYFTTILLVGFLIFSFTFLRGDITLENLRYLLKFISFTNTETSITASKINYPSGDPNRLELFIGDLCTLSPEGYALYDSRGNQIMAENIKYATPTLKIGERFALCFDLDGTAFTVLNTFSKLYEGSTEYPITDAAIAANGSFAIASSSREYRTAITLYDSDFKPVARVYKNDHLMALDLNEDSSIVTVMTSGAKNGEFYSRIELISPNSENVLKSCELSGLGYALYPTDTGFAVITDESVCFLDNELELVRAYKHYSKLSMTDSCGQYIACMYSDSVIGNSYHALIYSSDGELVFEGDFDGKLIALDFEESGDYLFILTGTTVSRINLINDKIGTFTVESDAIDLLAQEPNSVLVCKKNYALTYEFTNFAERYFDRVGASDTKAETESADTAVDSDSSVETDVLTASETEAPEETASEETKDTSTNTEESE